MSLRARRGGGRKGFCAIVSTPTRLALLATLPTRGRVNKSAPRVDEEIYFAFGASPNRLAIIRSCMRLGKSPINRRDAWPGVMV